jgi:hypothetical protein
MKFAEEIMGLVFGSPEFTALRDKALAGDPEALRRYAFWAVWNRLQQDRTMRPAEGRRLFKELVEKVDLKVTLNG